MIRRLRTPCLSERRRPSPRPTHGLVLGGHNATLVDQGAKLKVHKESILAILVAAAIWIGGSGWFLLRMTNRIAQLEQTEPTPPIGIPE